MKRRSNWTSSIALERRSVGFGVLSVSFAHVHQVLLLSGPAGLGKTTLAHVIAQHAGYEVVEINAR